VAGILVLLRHTAGHSDSDKHACFKHHAHFNPDSCFKPDNDSYKNNSFKFNVYKNSNASCDSHSYWFNDSCKFRYRNSDEYSVIYSDGQLYTDLYANK